VETRWTMLPLSSAIKGSGNWWKAQEHYGNKLQRQPPHGKDAADEALVN
jgi:hypothetical protein